MGIKMKLSIVIIIILLALPTYTRALEEAPGKATELKFKADKYMAHEQYSEALTTYTHALELANRQNDSHTAASCLGNIGNIYGEMGDFDRAEHYFKKGYDMALEQKDLSLQQKFAINLVMVNCEKGNVEEARKYYNIQMGIPLKLTPVMRYYALNNQSTIAMAAHDYITAHYYLKKVRQYIEDTGLDYRYLCTTYGTSGSIYMMQKRPKEAIKNFLTELQLAKKNHDAKLVCSIYRQLYVTYNMTGNTQKAQDYKMRYLSLSDSLFDQNRMHAAQNKLFDYENQLNDQIISNLTERSRMLMAYVGLFLCFIIVLSMLYVKLRRRNKHLLEAQQLLIEKNKELTKQDDASKAMIRKYAESIGHKVHSDNEETADEGRQTSLLTAEQQTILLDKINRVMDDIATISRQDFSLNMLAELVGSNTKYVSAVINENYGMNFKTYLNEHRIREACRRLSDAQHYGNMTIQAIYEELGYKSGSSFVQAFRKLNGMNPSQYQKLASTMPDKQKDQAAG